MNGKDHCHRGTIDVGEQESAPGADPEGDAELAAAKAFSRKITAWLLKGQEELRQTEAREEPVFRRRVEASKVFNLEEAKEHSRRITAWLLGSREQE